MENMKNEPDNTSHQSMDWDIGSDQASPLQGQGLIGTGYSNGTKDEDDLPNPWPPNGAIARSTSGSSIRSGSSQEAFEIMYPDDGNITVNKSSNSIVMPALPRCNVPEKIIICLDLSVDPDATLFRFGDGSKFTPLVMMKRVLQIFLYSKNLINKHHQYALVVLHSQSATWLHDFTSNPRQILHILENLTESPRSDKFDLSMLFEVIHDNIELPPVEDETNAVPPYVVRAILLYSRSHCLPVFSNSKNSFEAVHVSPYFFLDVLYLHEPVTDENKDKCESIFQALYAQVCNGQSYVYTVSRRPTKLHDCMSKLLAHALQRPAQEETDYKLSLPE